MGAEIEKFMKKAITKHFGVLDAWCDELSQEKKAGTVMNYLNAVAKFAEWYATFNPARLRKLKGADYLGFFAVVKMMRKNISKRRREEGSSKSMQDEVYMRHLPEGGFPALQEVVLMEYLRLTREVEKELGEYGKIKKKTYNEVSQLVISAFYVLMPQGRVGGFEGLTMEHIPALLAQGHTLSTTFKTKAKYGYQPIIATDLVIEIMRFYIDEVRPTALKNIRLAPEQPAVTNSVWLKFDGSPDKPGRRLTDFFQRTMQLHVTTTTLRGLMETETKKAETRGEITTAERISVQNVNGHTGAVVKDFYLRQDRSADAAAARRTFTTMSVANLERACVGEKTEGDDSNPRSKTARQLFDEEGHVGVGAEEFEKHRARSLDLLSVLKLELAHRNWPTTDKLEPAQWGANHPEKRKNPVRVNWSEAELKYIVEWCTNAVVEHSSWRKTIVAKCREAIWHDPVAMKIFHVNHVLDSGKLMAGYKKAVAEGMFPNYW